MRVLVCDDDPAARFVAKRWLGGSLGCTVTECEDGVEALALLAEQPFDLALIDLDLPGLNGVEVVEAIRTTDATRDLPIVIQSQERREDIVRRLVALGVSAYLLKPLLKRTVLSRIGPLLAARRAAPGGSVRARRDARLAPGSPAMLVDGDDNFRHTFTSVAGHYGPVVTATSGAEALAHFRRSPVDIIFIGTGLGMLGAETLVRKIRDEAKSPPLIVGVGVGAADPGAAIFDTTIPRLFVTDALAAALGPFVRPAGQAAGLDDVAPQYRECLSSAVTQVFGMMAGVDAVAAEDAPLDGSPVFAATVDFTIDSRFELHVELALPGPLADEISQRLMACDPPADDETCQATAGELMNMISGRLTTWLKGRELANTCSLPQVRKSESDLPFDTSGRNDFSFRFHLADFAQHLVLRGRVATKDPA